MAVINQEEINDCAKLMMHRLIAIHLRKDLSPIEWARNRMAVLYPEMNDIDFVRDWNAILARPASDIRRAITRRDEYSQWLRLSSPLATAPAVGLADVDFRRRLWRLAKRHVEQRTNASPLPSRTP